MRASSVSTLFIDRAQGLPARSAPLRLHPNPRARASATPTARSANSVRVCTASRIGRVVARIGGERADQPFDQRAEQRGRRDRDVLLGN